MQIAARITNVLCVTQKCINATYKVNAKYRAILANYLEGNQAINLSSCVMSFDSKNIPFMLSELWNQYIEPTLVSEKLGVLSFLAPNPLDVHLYQVVYPLSYKRKLRQHDFVITSDLHVDDNANGLPGTDLIMTCEHISEKHESGVKWIEQIINKCLNEQASAFLSNATVLESVSHSPQTATTRCAFRHSRTDCHAMLPIIAAIIDNNKGIAIKKFTLRIADPNRNAK